MHCYPTHFLNTLFVEVDYISRRKAYSHEEMSSIEQFYATYKTAADVHRYEIAVMSLRNGRGVHTTYHSTSIAELNDDPYVEHRESDAAIMQRLLEVMKAEPTDIFVVSDFDTVQRIHYACYMDGKEGNLLERFTFLPDASQPSIVYQDKSVNVHSYNGI